MNQIHSLHKAKTIRKFATPDDSTSQADELNKTSNFKNKISLLRKTNTTKLEACLTELIDTFPSLTQVMEKLNNNSTTLNQAYSCANSTHLNKGKYEYAFNFDWEHESAFSGKGDDGMYIYVISKEKLNTLAVEECIEASLFNNKWIIVKRALDQFQFDDGVEKNPDTMTFVDKSYEHNLFKDNTSATRQHYSVAKWNNISAISQPENKISYNEKVKRFASDAWERRQVMSQMEPNSTNWRHGSGQELTDRGPLAKNRATTDRDQKFSYHDSPNDFAALSPLVPEGHGTPMVPDELNLLETNFSKKEKFEEYGPPFADSKNQNCGQTKDQDIGFYQPVEIKPIVRSGGGSKGGSLGESGQKDPMRSTKGTGLGGSKESEKEEPERNLNLEIKEPSKDELSQS